MSNFFKGHLKILQKVNSNSESLKIQPYTAQYHVAWGVCYETEGSGGRVLPGLNGLRNPCFKQIESFHSCLEIGITIGDPI